MIILDQLHGGVVFTICHGDVILGFSPMRYFRTSQTLFSSERYLSCFIATPILLASQTLISASTTRVKRFFDWRNRTKEAVSVVLPLPHFQTKASFMVYELHS